MTVLLWFLVPVLVAAVALLWVAAFRPSAVQHRGTSRRVPDLEAGWFDVQGRWRSWAKYPGSDL
jgi:hypothetical protein